MLIVVVTVFVVGTGVVGTIGVVFVVVCLFWVLFVCAGCYYWCSCGCC